MKRRALVLAASVIAAIDAACPNLCSGSGTCGLSDTCECFPGYTGADCSLRVCVSGLSWGSNDASAHAYQECSGQGACDRVTGECHCFPGFTGRACSRSVCPGDCSGNGQCTLLKDLPLTVAYASTNWDAARIAACVCDAGWTGADCSQRTCPTGDDPLTVPSTMVRGQVQEIRFTLGSRVGYDPTATTAYVANTYTSATEFMDIFGTSSLVTPDTARAAGAAHIVYTDPSGGEWTAHSVDGVLAMNTASGNALARDNLEIALETLPGAKVKDVNVETAMAKTGAANNGGIDLVYQRRFLVTFVPDDVSSTNVGLQRTLKCSSAYSCSEAGCQPQITMPFLYRYAGTPSDTTIGASVTAYGTGTGIDFYTTDKNVNADFTAGKFLRLHPDSQPQMTPGVAIDTGVASTTAATYNRYDMRILVAVVDVSDGQDGTVDVYYTRVIVGHNNITSSNERVGFAAGTTGVWGTGKTFTTTLDGFTYNGPIPAKSDQSGVADKVPVPGAPGAFLSFPSRNIVTTDGAGRWYEILIKLPHCTVTPMLKAGDLLALGSSTAINPVDTNVENIECSGRGKCNRGTGECNCFSGYAGPACSTQSVISF